MALWTDNPVWSAPRATTTFRWNNHTSGFGACQFTAQAFGDLDDDGVMSTYERSGAADEVGVDASAGLNIDREVESMAADEAGSRHDARAVRRFTDRS